METIPIFFTFDRYYVLAACVAFHSLLTNAAPEYQYQLYVVHTDLQPHHIQRIKKVVSHFHNANIQFKNASHYDTAWDKLRNKSHFSKEIRIPLLPRLSHSRPGERVYGGSYNESAFLLPRSGAAQRAGRGSASAFSVPGDYPAGSRLRAHCRQ